MAVIIPIASGKGGVGKTMIAANLGISLAEMNKRVIIIDFDLGGSNLHTCLGIKNRYNGIGSFLNKKVDSLTSCLVKTDYHDLTFIPGDNLIPGTANLNYFMKLKMLKEIYAMEADFILLDLGAGSAFNTLDFYLMSNTGITIITPETTSVLNAYEFIKAALYRLLYQSFKRGSEERKDMDDFIHQRLETSDADFNVLINQLEQYNPESAELCNQKINRFYPRVILNMALNQADIQLGGKLRFICRKNLNIELEYLGILPMDQLVGQAAKQRVPVYMQDSNCPFSRGIRKIAHQLLKINPEAETAKYENNEDLLFFNNEISKSENEITVN